jgi:hypothetical protein
VSRAFVEIHFDPHDHPQIVNRVGIPRRFSVTF